ncbi:zinc ribbon domain-containing protein [Halobacterium sp. KA-4]|uniref:DUF7575 domain-containing protein n=1 Tax=Halobacterium sp. KA-4 TaxID=2896367 RepID=UPI001E40EB50|nr:zinc ribbon domain-containing protein [Halobacterium sp. KA-4]MCD2201531.1 zinc ribbon domain-containing protein [Halobacterium sp. KA-4]
MSQSLSGKRPWLAALLNVLAIGLGHAYLRRWWRAFGWITALFGAATLFVDPAALEAFMRGQSINLLSIAPVLVVGALSVVDAYLVAHAQNMMARFTPNQNRELTHCPHCGKELGLDLDFCQWCSADLTHTETASPAERPDKYT